MNMFTPTRAGAGRTTVNSSGKASRGSQFVEKAQSVPEVSMTGRRTFDSERESAVRQRRDDEETRALINDGVQRGMLTAADLRGIVAARTKDPAIRAVQRTTAAALFTYDITDEHPRATHIRFSNQRTIPEDLYSDSHWHDERSAKVYGPGDRLLAVINASDPSYGPALEALMPHFYDGIHDLGPMAGAGIRAFGEPDPDGSTKLDVRAALEWCPTEPLREPRRGIRGVLGW
jgi:hypothetical protein